MTEPSSPLTHDQANPPTSQRAFKPGWLGRPIVLIATDDSALDLSALQPSGEGESLAKNVLGDGEVRSLLAEGRTVLLTDQYAPVEQMLAPVFRGESK